MLAALAEFLGSVFSSLVATPNSLQLQFQGVAEGAQTYMQANVHKHKIKINEF